VTSLTNLVAITESGGSEVAPETGITSAVDDTEPGGVECVGWVHATAAELTVGAEWTILSLFKLLESLRTVGTRRALGPGA
jgi:hypothetical protein